MSGRANGDGVDVATSRPGEYEMASPADVEGVGVSRSDGPEWPGSGYPDVGMADEAARVRDTLAVDTGGGDLPQVLHTAPAAVALIDLDAGTVTYANGSATDLTGGRAQLPLDIDAWSEAAGLTDLSGRPMRDTASPLSRVAQGIPVSGEPVAIADAARKGSDATPEEREEAEGRLLWVTGFPLSEAEDDPRRRLALVVFLQLSGAGAQRHLEMMRDRAVVATELSFTISDPSKDQNPLVWVNPAFTRLTGYDLDEVLGRNCRFLQGPNTDPTSISGSAARSPTSARSPRSSSTTAATARPSGTRSRSRRCSTAPATSSTSSGSRPTSPSGSWSRTSAVPRSPRPRRPASSCVCSPTRPPR